MNDDEKALQVMRDYDAAHSYRKQEKRWREIKEARESEKRARRANEARRLAEQQASNTTRTNRKAREHRGGADVETTLASVSLHLCIRL
jgi:retron-type reverse transcriptase